MVETLIHSGNGDRKILMKRSSVYKEAEYHMNVHVFGGISSPSCSNYALRRTARDNNVKYDPEVAETLRSNFYVDDLLKSVKDEEIAVTLMKDVKALCAEGGFHLTKFVSNSKHLCLKGRKERVFMIRN